MEQGGHSDEPSRRSSASSLLIQFPDSIPLSRTLVITSLNDFAARKTPGLENRETWGTRKRSSKAKG